MLDQPIVILITVPSKEVGRQIAAALLEQKLAACINIVGPVNSLYTWEGRLNDDEEFLLIIKSRANLLEAGLIPAVQALHPYDLPEIIALPIQGGLGGYLEWITQATGG